MKIKNIFNYHDKFKSYIFIIIIQLLLSFIQSEKCTNCVISPDKSKCDCAGSENCIETNAKPHLADNSCYKCEGIIDFYSINNDGNCENKTEEGCPLKIIYDTKECVGHCPNDYCELGDFCYSDFSFGTYAISTITDLTVNNIPFKECKCIGRYNISFVTGKKSKYDCVGSCNNKYYNSDTNECVDKCTAEQKTKEIYIDDVLTEIRCSSKCEFGELLYRVNNSCLDNCPNNTFQKKNTDLSEECVEKCDIYKFEGDSPFSCVNECEDNEIIVFGKNSLTNIEDPIKFCIKREEYTKYYYYNGIYFEDCLYTKKYFNNDINTYPYDKDSFDITNTIIETTLMTSLLSTSVFEESPKKLCVEDCSSFDNNMFFDGNKCVPKCQNYYYKKKCVDKCETQKYTMNFNMIDKEEDIPSFTIIGTTQILDTTLIIDTTTQIMMTDVTSNPIITINKNDYPNPYECLENCPTGTFVDEDKHQCYVLKCNYNKYIKSDLKCGTCGKDDGFIVKENFFLELSSNSEIPGQTLPSEIYNITREYCLSSCPKSSPYHNYGENECFKTNCSERGKVSAYDDPYICYQSCQDIIGYNNEQDKICYKETIACDKDFFYIDEGIKQCASETDCINKNFKYIQEKECRTYCNNNYYKIEPKLNNYKNIEKLGSCFSDPKDCINQKYSFFNLSDKICREECDSYRTYPEIAQNEKNETCFNLCPSNFPYEDQISINQKNQKVCLKKCDEKKFFYGNKCLENCNDKYYFENTKECVDICKKGNTYYYKIGESNNNTCFFSCPNSYPFVTNALAQQNEPYICKKQCDLKAPYYYDDLKVCRKDCDVLYSSNSSSYQCVYQCEPGEKVIYNKNCTKKCPNTMPYISKEKLSNTNEIMVEKCLPECPSSFPLQSSKTNNCLTECPLDENYQYNGKCYEKCPNNTYTDEIRKECFKDKCPNEFKYYERENGTYICKTSCPSRKFFLKEGGECMNKCPADYNYIGFDNICLKKCSSEYGEYFEKSDDEQYRYKCLKTCGKLVLNDTKECVSECPPNDYFKSPNNICYKSCDLDKDNPFSTKNDNGTKICSKKCHNSEPNYGENYICKVGCSDSTETSIIDYDGKCVSSCTNPYYKFIENKKCVNKCTKYVNKNNECVDKCEGDYNYVEDNECRKSCDEHHFAQKDNENNNMFLCVTKCDPDKYYYEEGTIYTKRKCLDNCEKGDLVIQDTHICYVKCPSNYYSYYYINNLDSTDNIELTYHENTCVIKCPKDKPYINSGTCTSECPFTKKYHIEGEFNCIAQCPEGSKIDNNECKSYCSDNKFLDKNQCVDKCSAPNNFYIENSKKCINECGKDYYIEGDKCVKYCSGNYSYIYDTKCVSKCESKKVYINQTEEGPIKICQTECQQYSYYNGTLDLTFCLDDCNFKNGTECLSICEGEYKFYDYENGKCLDRCPDEKPFSITKDTDSNNIICYQNCPNEYPYKIIDSSICSDKCDKYLNVTSRECSVNCLGKTYYDENTKNNYCLNNCEELGLFEFGNTCVKECSSLEEENLVENMATKTCECKNLYYKDGNGAKICLKEENCVDKYRLFGTYQCLDKCIGDNFILSLDEKFCYESEDNCPSNTERTQTNNANAPYKCDCKYKFYEDDESKKICLGKNDFCPEGYFLEVDDNKNNKCVKTCTNGQIDNICLNGYDNSKYWYYDEDNNQYKILDTCQGQQLYQIENSKQCVKNCKLNNYNVYLKLGGKKECGSNCNSFNNSIIKKVDSDISIYECSCADLWKREVDDKIICNENKEKNTCIEAFGDQFNYLIKETKECVSSCPNEYQFKFGFECFQSCENIKMYYGFDFIVNDINKECECPNLWKIENNKKICMKNNICYEENYNLLISDTKQCTKTCPDEEDTQYIQYNNTCYKECPKNTESFEGSCKCKYKWYKYNDISLGVNDIYICLDEKDDCPKDFYPYLNAPDGQCVLDISNCSEGSIIFNYTCYESCPDSTKPKENSCECDKEKGKWFQYVYEGKELFQCGLDKCPEDRKYLDIDSQECKFSCENKYHYDGGCYSTCPQNTKLIDELSKECVETYTFEESKDLKSLEENIKTNIKKIYEKTSSSNGVIYNINNSTMQIYGINKNKEDKKDTIMRNNLTYIDLSYCLDKLYQKNGLSEDTDIIIVKYDIGEKANSSTINPVEFKIINSKTGEEIPLSACEDNSIIISYPLMNILNSFITESNNLRNLEEDENKKNLNLREKFFKGKEININNKEIDTFDLSNKLYTDICYPFKMNGKDLILEDRLNYLYPFCSFCESNCIYNKTDFISERVYCNCNPKDQINFERQLELMNSNPNMEKTKKDQKASILKCLGKISEISKNFGFFYGLIIILAEIAMCILTFLYSYKVFVMRINKKFALKGDDNFNNINTENLENANLSGRDKNYDKNKNEEIIKTSERNLENPPKKKKQINIIETKEDKKEKRKDTNKKTTNKREEIIGNADIINIKKTEKDRISQKSREGRISSNSYNLYVEKSSEGTFKDSEDDSIFDLIKLESTLLTVDYQKALQKNKAEILIMILTEILDKIYFIKAILFLRKYAIVSLYVSLYLLWHMLIISFLSLFYNYSNLHKIWINDNYPNLNFHLSFGFLSCIISFIFYKGLSFLIFNDRKIAELESIPKENKNEINEKYNKMMFWAKIKIIIFYAIVFILCIIFFLYLIAFCGVYIGTKAKLAESYGIALIEVVIIKILYGIVLGILRKVSLSYEIEKLYFIVRILDLYIS